MHATLTALTAVAVAVAAASGASAAIPSDMRPDSVASGAKVQSQPRQDLRSPDNRDTAAALGGQSQVRQDLRSPDTRDTAVAPQAARDIERYAEASTYRPSPVPVQKLTAEPDGFPFDTFAIASGGALGLALITVATMMRFRRRASRAHMPAALG